MQNRAVQAVTALENLLHNSKYTHFVLFMYYISVFIVECFTVFFLLKRAAVTV